MQADHSHLLSQLQDIHSAGDPGWWPPAPGWWLVGGVLLLALVFLFRAAASKLAALRRRREWLHALDQLNREHDLENDPQAWLAALNRWFRAVALRAFPGTACAGLQGEEWVAFISSLMPEETANGSLAALAQGPYEALPEFDAPALDGLARTWVKLYG